jgi:hypothetical protein
MGNGVLEKDIRVFLRAKNMDSTFLLQAWSTIDDRISQNLVRSAVELTPAEEPVVDRQWQGYSDRHASIRYPTAALFQGVLSDIRQIFTGAQ